jgi:acyl-CoA synthetase (AMP-forming)/AMP-acid ligase II
MVCALPPQRFLAGEPGCGSPLDGAELRLDADDGVVAVRSARLALGWLEPGGLQPLPLSADGWWRSGDAGRFGAAGLELLGRLDGAINSGGETVFPEQLEARLQAEAAAEGLPLAAVLLLAQDDPLWGQRLVALVRAEARTQEAAQGFLDAARKAAAALPGADHLLADVTLFPAVPMTIQRIANVERAQMLVESPSRAALQRFLGAWQAALHATRAQAPGRGVIRWAIDVDPLGI